MSSTPEFQNICFNSNSIKDSTIVETTCQTGIDVDSIKSVLSVFATAKPTSTSVQNGKLNVSVKTSVYVCYLDNQDIVCKKECALSNQATFSLAQEVDANFISSNAFVDGVEYDNSGLNLSVTARVKVQYTAIRNESISALTGGENLICIYKEQSLVKGVGVKEGTYPIEENFELTGIVNQVLHHDATCQISAVQCGVGRVIVDGNAIFTLIVLQNEQNSSIIKEVRTLPFRMEVEFEQAMPTMSAIVNAVRQSVKTDIEVIEEDKKSNVTISSNLTFSVSVFEEQAVSVVKDAFSKFNHVALESDKRCFYTPMPTLYESASVSSRANVEELPIGASLTALACENVTVSNASKEGDSIVVDGVVDAVAYFIDAERQVFVRRVECAFSKKLDQTLDNECEYQVTASAFGAKGKIISAVEMDIETQLELCVQLAKKCEFSYIKDVKVGEQKAQNTHGISVYIGLEGEELFSLSKRLNESPDMVVETNKDLSFPLTGKERIVIFRQLDK